MHYKRQTTVTYRIITRAVLYFLIVPGLEELSRVVSMPSNSFYLVFFFFNAMVFDSGGLSVLIPNNWAECSLSWSPHALSEYCTRNPSCKSKQPAIMAQTQGEIRENESACREISSTLLFPTVMWVNKSPFCNVSLWELALVTSN